MRASLLQIDVRPDEQVADRRSRVAALVREQAGADLVVLPELWPVGAFAYQDFATYAEPLDGPTARELGAAARAARVWLHAGSIVERSGADGPLYNTSLLFAPDGQLHRFYRKIHRFGFDQGEAAMMAAGDEIVTARLSGPQTTIGLATCYDLRFPEQFRLLVDAGAQLLVICAGWPERRSAHWSLLARARAVESQAYVLACGTAGTHAGVQQAGRSVVVDPWGEVLAEAGTGEEVLTVDLDPSRVEKTRAEFPALRDRVLGLPKP
ncbi:carbon-nitrogen family hydrolase [Streptomyces sp. RPT161]|uniref:carbon-nitrogen family hydrolase n=1 Tax=Streptomyces sp. RPT161 TaxID=3015993 RepID=UPI0022B8810B|nr:carbon-nitrogen family hydrolase [Streptomyces sp. RPT161]